MTRTLQFLNLFINTKNNTNYSNSNYNTELHTTEWRPTTLNNNSQNNTTQHNTCKWNKISWINSHAHTWTNSSGWWYTCTSKPNNKQKCKIESNIYFTKLRMCAFFTHYIVLHKTTVDDFEEVNNKPTNDLPHNISTQYSVVHNYVRRQIFCIIFLLYKFKAYTKFTYS